MSELVFTAIVVGGFVAFLVGFSLGVRAQARTEDAHLTRRRW